MEQSYLLHILFKCIFSAEKIQIFLFTEARSAIPLKIRENERNQGIYVLSYSFPILNLFPALTLSYSHPGRVQHPEPSVE